MLNKILTFCLILSSIFTFSQTEKILNLPSFDKPMLHYGFYLGGNSNSYKISYQTNTITDTPNIGVESAIGFNVGLIADLRLHNNLNIRFEPGLISNTKTLNFNHITGTKNQKNRETGATYLHLPVLLKLSTNRLNNIRPYAIGGVSFDYNFSSNQNNNDDNSAGEFRTTSSNFMYEIGLGIDIYLPYFKFSPSIRGLFAINNELVRDNPSTNGSQWTDPISYLGTRGIFLHLAFE